MKEQRSTIDAQLVTKRDRPAVPRYFARSPATQKRVMYSAMNSKELMVSKTFAAAPCFAAHSSTVSITSTYTFARMSNNNARSNSTEPCA